MDIFQSLFLGIIQGLTEFLPISSSGHLVIFEKLLGISEPEIFFDVCLHMGTLLAVLIYYFKTVSKLFLSCFDFNGIKSGENKDFPMVLMIIIGSVPTAIIGLIIKKYGELIFANIFLTGIMLFITSAILASSKFAKDKPLQNDSLTQCIKKALIVGTVQGCAVFPGISRSGSTIVTCLFLGFEKKQAASFSFLLSVPAILGAQLLAIKDISQEYIAQNIVPVAAGTFISFITGYLALIFLIKIVNKGKLYFFAPYCLMAGAACMILTFI